MHKDGTFWIPMNQLSSTGLFIAIIIGLFLTDLYVWMVHKKITIKMPANVPPAVNDSFTALFPFFFLFTACLDNPNRGFTPIETIPNLMQYIFKPLSVVGTSLPGVLICELLVLFLWTFGIHGPTLFLVL